MLQPNKSSISTITKLQEHFKCLALHQNIAKQITKHFKGTSHAGSMFARNICLLRQGNPFSCKSMSGEMRHESERTLGIHKLLFTSVLVYFQNVNSTICFVYRGGKTLKVLLNAFPLSFTCDLVNCHSGAGILPRILDRCVPRRFLNPNPI